MYFDMSLTDFPYRPNGVRRQSVDARLNGDYLVGKDLEGSGDPIIQLLSRLFPLGLEEKICGKM